MTPYERAARWHLARCPGEPFLDLVEAHFQHGHVLAGPDLFLLGRPIRRDWPEDRIRDPWDANPAGDCWHVWLFAGDLRAIPPVIPRPLPFVSFHRGPRFVVLPFPRLLRSLARE